MAAAMDLREYLARSTGQGVAAPAPGDLAGDLAAEARVAQAVASAVLALADAAVTIASWLRLGDLADLADCAAPARNADGDRQTPLDLRAHELCRAALLAVPVAAFASEEAEAPELGDAASPIAVAVDPLDGSSNLAVAMSVGTIFSVRPAGADARAAFLAPGHTQLAAGFFLYGPQTVLVLTLGATTDIFTLDPRAAAWRLTGPGLMVPAKTSEYAINAANARHWPHAVRTYIGDCVAGRDGVRAEDFNTRWIASLVAEAYRILRRGGVFLYPADARPGYQNGRLRLVYEAHPMALILHAAGALATDGARDILDLPAASLHQRVPLIMGSAAEVSCIRRLYEGPGKGEASPPLFQSRGLFRAGQWGTTP